ncbi:MAG TPA: type II toxin-antitoxin system HigB family toxin [Povalibacter sp.]|uniref:type II toxin-antitoxin system HigB family toxin n=1 Tax=Povalibacter sp. TaxID=1962978 RepID=UPI002CE5360C|nr:type II toxin-antitoxin system HigB family toxin [Povalibacter sp.]HMN45884.1 type II toxin-antitoxin system HigB family toxin [Povalibacter sp.]
MKVVGRSRLHAFVEGHADARRWLANWLADAERAAWRTPHDIKRHYASASILERNVVIFNVRGNEYRMEVTVSYNSATVVINWIGTHAEYDRRNRQRTR